MLPDTAQSFREEQIHSNNESGSLPAGPGWLNELGS
jgi:hypothetical protein